MGVNLYVIGIGKAVHPEELLKIAGSTERVFLAKSFEELQSRSFVYQFNISCGKERSKFMGHPLMFFRKKITNIYPFSLK